MTQSKQAVFADAAPSPRRGLYNQAIIVNSMVYTSGFTPVDPRSGLLVRGSVADRAVSVYQGTTKPVLTSHSDSA